MQSPPRAVLVGSLCALGAVLVLALIAQFNRSRTPPLTEAERLRAGTALLIERHLRENGCAECKARADGAVLVIASPGTAPRRLAEAVQANPDLLRLFRQVGITHLRAVQGSNTYEDGFLYPVN